MADTRDTIRTDILINAKAAIQSLREMSAAASSNEERIAKFSSFLVQKSKEWNVPLGQLLNTFKQLNAELSKQHKANIFGNVGGKDIFAGSKGFLDAAFAAERFRTTNEGVVAGVGKTAKAMESAEKATKSWSHRIDVVKTALGTLVAVGIFTFLQAIQQAFHDAVQGARELEDSLFRLHNVEKILSEGGTEISTKGLRDGILEIKKLFPIFSKEDITQLVAQIAISTKELGLSEQQILDLAKAIGVLNIRSTENETASQTAQKVISSLITGNAKGISTLGVSFSEATMSAKGLEMGIITADKSLADLTDNEKGMIKVQLLLENTGDEANNLSEYMETNTGKLKANAASWQDLLTTVGSIFTALTPLLTPFLEAIQRAVNGFKLMLAIAGALGETMRSFDTNIFEFGDKLQENLGEKIRQLFSEVPTGMSDQFTSIIENYLGPLQETETGIADLQESFDSIDTEKASDALEDMLKDLEALGEKMEEAERDFQTKLTRFDEDALEDRARLVEDYNLDVQQTIRSFALRRAELEQKYRQNELDKEAKFQEQLRQLREKFLYNLEDALRERDARQVLRLIDQYNMDKTAMVNEHNLERELAQQQHQEELNDLKAQEAERLRVMAEEQALRLQRQEEDSALRRQRMLEDHAQEIADLMAQKEEILREAADKIAKEYGLNEEGAKAIYDLLNKYYGGDGILEKLVADGYRGMLGQSEAFLAQLQQIIALQQGLMAQASGYSGYQPLSSTTSGSSGGTGGGGSGGGRRNGGGRRQVGMASGGQFLATRPTNLRVGEGNNPEIVSVIPLAKLLGGSMGIGGAGGSNGMNGKIEVAVSLSAGLEGEIINKTLDSVGEIVSRVNRSKS